jgi:hypothetical protein
LAFTPEERQFAQLFMPFALSRRDEVEATTRSRSTGVCFRYSAENQLIGRRPGARPNICAALDSSYFSHPETMGQAATTLATAATKAAKAPTAVSETIVLCSRARARAEDSFVSRSHSSAWSCFSCESILSPIGTSSVTSWGPIDSNSLRFSAVITAASIYRTPDLRSPSDTPWPIELRFGTLDPVEIGPAVGFQCNSRYGDSRGDNV